MRRVLLPFCVALLGLLACRERTLARPPFDAGIVCGKSEKLVEGECHFVCSRDTECQVEQRCNLLTGVCETRPTPEARPPQFPCTTGAQRCAADNRSLEKCDADGGWQVEKVCPPPSGFCSEERCLACQPGVASCQASDPNSLTVCLEDGSGTRTVSCADGARCIQGECRECAPNTSRCSPDGRTVQVCQRTSAETLTWKWENVGDAFDGTCITQVCEPSPAPPHCKPPSCFPGATRCKSSSLQEVCSDQGAWTSVACSSLPGYSPVAECQNGVCVDECADAIKAKSYFGCEYWTAVQDNSVDPLFKAGTLSGQGSADSDFALVVANRSTNAANVEVWRYAGSQPTRVKSVSVPARTDPATKGLAVIKLPWQSIGPASNPVGIGSTGQLRYAYRLTSSKPVSVYQFSPLDAVRLGKTCGGLFSVCNEAKIAGECKTANGQQRCHYYSYSNDASLLLPAHILGTSHVVIAPEHLSSAASQSAVPSDDMNTHVTIVAPSDGTTVTVKLSAKTKAGGSIAALNRGATQTFTLNSYDVLQLATDNLGASYTECSPNPFGTAGVTCRVNNDLTGTVITSDKPVAVFAGSACTLRPHSAAACDHVEEQLFPFNAWGKSFVALQSHPLRMASGGFATATQAAPDHWKIVAGCPASQCPNGTLITFSTPPVKANILPPNRCAAGTSLDQNNCRLLGGDFMEFKSKANFTISADYPISVAQFFAGENATQGSFFDAPSQGDPSFLLLPPVEQWRPSYTVLTAPGIADNYLGLVIDDAKVKSIEIDGTAVTGFAAIPGTTFKVLNHPVSVGTHTINVVAKPGQTAIPGAGVTVYGFDSYVSYGYTGGLDLSTIVTGINPGG